MNDAMIYKRALSQLLREINWSENQTQGEGGGDVSLDEAKIRAKEQFYNTALIHKQDYTYKNIHKTRRQCRRISILGTLQTVGQVCILYLHILTIYILYVVSLQTTTMPLFCVSSYDMQHGTSGWNICRICSRQSNEK